MITFLRTQGEIFVGQEESITVVLKTLAIRDMSNFLLSSVFSRCFSTDKYFFSAMRSISHWKQGAL